MSVRCRDLYNIRVVILHSTESNQTQLAVVNQTAVIPRQAATDAQLIELWLHGRPPTTSVAYGTDIEQFFRFVNKPLHQITLGNVQDFADNLEELDLMPTSRHRKLSAIKSLFAFGHRIGYLPFDTARPLRLPSAPNLLAERILSEPEVNRIIALEPNRRNRGLLLVLYGSGIRVSELCAMKWQNVQHRDDGCQITVTGKGGRTRTILLPDSVASAIFSLQQNADENEPIFKSRKGGHLHPSQVMRIVRKAAERAGISKNVSPHWLRHGHASHALDRGAPIHLVQTTLGHSSVATTGRYLHARPTDSSSKYLAL